MGASIHESPASVSLALSDDLRAEVAYLRAHGQSWEEVAAAFGWNAAKLRWATRCDPNFEAELTHARLEAEKDAEAALLAKLHELVGDEDCDRAIRAAALLTRHIISKRREETRLAVEQFRTQRLIAQAEAEKAKTERQEKAKSVDAHGTVVYLSAGDRRIADTPLQLIRDKDAQVNGKPVYWAVPFADATERRHDPRAPEPSEPVAASA